MTHLERFNGAEAFDIDSLVTELRQRIGEFPDLHQPTKEEVETAIEKHFPQLLANEKATLCEEFFESERAAGAAADQEAKLLK